MRRVFILHLLEFNLRLLVLVLDLQFKRHIDNMKGKLFIKGNKWYVEYRVSNSFSSIPLHPDSEQSLMLRSDKQPDQMIGENIEFEIKVKYIDTHTNRIQRYALLTQCNGLDLQQLETKLDNALANETEESLTVWMSNKRRNPEAHFTVQDMIDFAKWIAKDWMSIWVEDKWMWEYQKEVGPHHPYCGYLTDEQLFKMYMIDKTE